MKSKVQIAFIKTFQQLYKNSGRCLTKFLASKFYIRIILFARNFAEYSNSESQWIHSRIIITIARNKEKR